MVEPEVLAKGHFRPENIYISAVEQSTQQTNPEIEAHIETTWESIVDDAKTHGRQVWNGMTQRVNELEVREAGELTLELAPLDFKHRECVVSYPGYYELPESYWRKGAYVSSFVRTADDWQVFVRLSGKSLNNKKEELIGGIVGDETPVTSGLDLYEEMYRELEEESAVPRTNVARMMLALVYFGPATNIGFHFMIQLKDIREEVETRFDQEGTDTDIHSLVFTRPEDLSQKLTDLGGYKPFVGKELGLM